MRADDFQWLADQIAEFFPVDLRAPGVCIVAEAQETLEEFERDRQRAEETSLAEVRRIGG
jgi:hypothetical protein